MLLHQVPVQSHLLSSGHDRRVQALQREMEVLASMSNEHIVQYYGMQYEADVVNIVRPFVFILCTHCFAVDVSHGGLTDYSSWSLFLAVQLPRF